jgi:hypothetical protein
MQDESSPQACSLSGKPVEQDDMRSVSVGARNGAGWSPRPTIVMHTIALRRIRVEVGEVAERF